VALDAGLRLLHPFMPFVTEELWQRLPRPGVQPPSIMVAEYPGERAGWDDAQLEKEFADMQVCIGWGWGWEYGVCGVGVGGSEWGCFGLFYKGQIAVQTATHNPLSPPVIPPPRPPTPPHPQAVVQTLRKLRADYALTRQRPACYVVCADAIRAAALSSLSAEAATLSSSSGVTVLGPEGGAPPAACSVAIVDDVTTVHMVLKVGLFWVGVGMGLESSGDDSVRPSLHISFVTFPRTHAIPNPPISHPAHHTQCTPNAHPMHTQCTHNAHPMRAQGILDPALEIAKLEKKRTEATGRAEQLKAKMALPSYQERTPENVKVGGGLGRGCLHAAAAFIGSGRTSPVSNHRINTKPNSIQSKSLRNRLRMRSGCPSSRPRQQQPSRRLWTCGSCWRLTRPRGDGCGCGELRIGWLISVEGF